MKRKNQSTKLSLEKKIVLNLAPGRILGGGGTSATCNKYTVVNCVTQLELECGITFMCIETRNPRC